MGASFSQSEAQAARGWLQRKVYTYGPVNLPAGTSTIFTAEYWQDPNDPQWLARLTKIAATQNSGVQLQWIFDGAAANQSQKLGYTDAMPADLQWMDVDAPALTFLQLVAVNNGSTVNNFQLNYEIEMQRLTVADKLLFGVEPSEQEKSFLDGIANAGGSGLQKVQDLVRSGKIPHSPQSQLDRYLAGISLGEDTTVSGIYHVTANNSTTEGQSFASASVKSGTFDVLEAVAVPGAQAITLYATVDNQPQTLQVGGAGFGQTNPAYPWRVFLPAVSSLNFSVSAASTLTAVPVQILVRRYRLTDLWRIRLGIVKAPTPAIGRLFAEVWGGIS